ncbi:hypothetical protein CRM22_007556 [Opisthorchis felineus]|uniref:Protein kinase domain-containing protein n=1 Tax=Opisthorchis felineus TaxID=147828 RepID=A0A4S2LN62_OPIFE|nr:hypothetical protein CRM22_007556 [Opisthorchis felineus]
MPVPQQIQDYRDSSEFFEKSEKVDPFALEFPSRSVPFVQDCETIGNADKHADRSVLKVFDKTLDLHYAVKVFHKHSLVKRGRRCVKQTIEEARIIRRLNHPFVVDFVGSWQSKSKLYLAMEYLSGGELFDLWKLVLRVSHPLLRFLVSQVALALDYLHSKSVIHRDLKMENMMLTETGYIKLIDFGASKQVEQLTSVTWTICGTLAYAAPEMLNGTGYTYLVDWWALGILCHALSCGEYPIQPVHDHLTMRRNLNALVYKPPDDLEPSLGNVICQYDPGIFFTDDDVVKLPDCSLKRQIQAIKRRSSRMSANGTRQPNRRRCNRSQRRKSIIRVSGPSDGVHMDSVSGPSESAQAPSDSSFQFRSNSKVVVSGTESANTNAPENICDTVNGPSMRKDALIRVVRIPAAKVLPQRWDCARNFTRPIQHTPDVASSDSASLTSQKIRPILDVSKQRHSYTNSVTDVKSVESPLKSRSRTDVRFMSDRQRRMSISGSRPVKIVHLLRRGESLRGLSRLSVASRTVRQSRPSLFQIVRELPVDGPQFRGLPTQAVVDSAPRPKLTTDRIFIWRPS